jgi:Co/Zn/Cd efflux system component
MFVVEVGAGVAAGSASLQADALDFLGDAANYAISLFVIGMALHYRATAALVKGATMGFFGLWVVGTLVWHAVHGTLPNAITMGAVGFAALIANAASFGLLFSHRDGDANMRSAWICTRNDVLGNLAVLLAAAGVFGTGTGWPDIIVAAIMAGLALQGSSVVVRQSLGELRQSPIARAERHSSVILFHATAVRISISRSIVASISSRLVPRPRLKRTAPMPTSGGTPIASRTGDSSMRPA